LLAKLHIDSLTTKNTVKAVREALKVLPKDLESTYEDTMRRIERQNDDDRDLAQRILTWIPNAKRPMSVAELREALAVETDATSLDLDGLLDIEIILSVCAGLVIVHNADGTVRLIHYTTQNYFDRVQTTRFPRAQVDITETCLTYLLFEAFANLQKLSFEKLDGHNQFLQYAAEFGLIHARGQPELELEDKILNFLEPQRCCNLLSLLVYNDDAKPPWTVCWPVSSKLSIVAMFNLLEIAKRLLALPPLQDASADGKTEALYLASHYGHLEMVQLLVEHGADVNAEETFCKNPLRLALWGGKDAVAEFLIEKGADVNAGMYETALNAAVSKDGSEAMIRLLVENGADVNGRGTENVTALQAASSLGNESQVRLLIEKGADVNAPGGDYGGTALQNAAAEGHETVVRQLIQQGADVNAEGGVEYGTALQAASLSGDEAVVHLLLAHGADVSAEGGEMFGTALEVASYCGHETLVRLFIEKGADVNARGKHCNYTNALQAASLTGHKKIVELLIENGADVNAEGREDCGTAIQIAFAQGCWEVVNVLKAKGAAMLTISDKQCPKEIVPAII
jgi:ankyrin repeat protein